MPVAAGSASQAISHLRHNSLGRQPDPSSKSQTRQFLPQEAENRLENRLLRSLQTPNSRLYQPTYTGYLSE